MKIVPTEMQGVFLIENFAAADKRGIFCKTFNNEDFQHHGIEFQQKESFYTVSKKDVVRGMHFQIPPHDLDKIVYVPRGAILDVVLDLRKGSLAYQKFLSFEISSENFRSVYIPKGVAHGFKALEDDTLTVYAVSEGHHPGSDKGVKWDSFGFDWGIETPVISERDQNFVGLAEFSSPF